MRGWIRGNWRHLMVGLLCAAIVISGTALYLTCLLYTSDAADEL